MMDDSKSKPAALPAAGADNRDSRDVDDVLLGAFFAQLEPVRGVLRSRYSTEGAKQMEGINAHFKQNQGKANKCEDCGC